jgi:hypothetical protein
MYAGIIGAAWDRLHPAVYKAHLNGSERIKAHAVFRVTHGKSILARVMVWIGRLPAESEAAPVTLDVQRVPEGETWRRTFGNTRLDSLQFDAGDGLMTEKIGLMAIGFRLSVKDGTLIYTQEAAHLVNGGLRVRIPQALSIRISAIERVGADGKSPHTSVTVSAPLVGMLAHYEGDLIVEASGSLD